MVRDHHPARTEGADHLLATADATGVSHFVAQSHASRNEIRKGGWVKTEEDPLDPKTGTMSRKGAEAIRHVEDVVVKAGGAVLRYRAFMATVLAVEQKARGVFNIVDDEPAPASEWLPYLAACAGAKPPMRVPKWLARLLAREVAVTMMTEGRGFSNAKAKRELGWELRDPSWRQGFKEGLV
jgi:hypothetical protein